MHLLTVLFMICVFSQLMYIPPLFYRRDAVLSTVIREKSPASKMLGTGRYTVFFCIGRSVQTWKPASGRRGLPRLFVSGGAVQDRLHVRRAPLTFTPSAFGRRGPDAGMCTDLRFSVCVSDPDGRRVAGRGWRCDFRPVPALHSLKSRRGRFRSCRGDSRRVSAEPRRCPHARS